MQKGKNKFTCILLFGYYFFRNKMPEHFMKSFPISLSFPIILSKMSLKI